MIIAVGEKKKAKKGKMRYNRTIICGSCCAMVHQYVYARSPSEAKEKFTKKGYLCAKCIAQ